MISPMRTRRLYWEENIKEFDQIASFGGAIIVRDLRNRYEIRGGTEQERRRAHDWMLQFMWPADQPKPRQWPGIEP